MHKFRRGPPRRGVFLRLLTAVAIAFVGAASVMAYDGKDGRAYAGLRKTYVTVESALNDFFASAPAKASSHGSVDHNPKTQKGTWPKRPPDAKRDGLPLHPRRE